MTRANAANDPARAGSLQELARALAPAQPRAADLDRVVRRLVPVLVAVFLAVLTGGVCLQIGQARDRAFNDAVSDLEVMGALLSARIDGAQQGDDPGRAADAVLRALPSRILSAGRSIAVSDAAGMVVASLPATSDGTPPAGPASLADRLGPGQPLTVLADKAGVLRVTLADGTDALATVRSLRAPLGQVALLQPVEGLLADWWAAALRAGIVLVATTFVLSVIASAYLWQSHRAHAAERHYGKVHGRIDTALNRGRCGLWDWDLARGRIYWSESMYAMLGMEPSSAFVSFGDVNGLVHPLDEDLAGLAERLAAGALDAIDHVFRLRNAAGAWVWLRVRAELVRELGGDPCLVGIAVDITDEKLLAERSATADRRLSDAIEAISESFALWDADRRLVTCNVRYAALHRLHAEAFPLDHRPAELVCAGLTSPTVARGDWPFAAPGGGAGWSHEVHLADGRWLQISELRTKDGGIVSVGTDITTHKLHEQRLMDSERRLMATVADLRRSRQVLESQAEALAMQARELAEMAERHREKKAEAEGANRAKAVFLAHMSHELRTPLNAIIGFSDIMCAETFGPLGSAKYAGYAADIRASGETLLHVISNVLEMSRLEAGRVRLTRTTFGVEDVVRAAVSAVGTGATARGLDVRMDVDPACTLHADRAAVEKVLHTILANACRFTGTGDIVTVRARRTGEALSMVVADTGSGIEPGALSRLGRPFEQTEAALCDGLKGSGLGLAIARSLVELHGGTLRLKSRPGQGTVVRARLPAPRGLTLPAFPLQA